MGWNVRDGLGDGERAPQILQKLQEIEPDVAILSEANRTTTGDSVVMTASLEQLKAAGYLTERITYDDTDDRPDKHELVLIKRRQTMGEAAIKAVRLGSRNALWTRLEVAPRRFITYIGAHLDDRSEQSRLDQITDLRRFLTDMTPKIFEGDLNSMVADDWKAQLLRPLRYVLPNNVGSVLLEHGSFAYKLSLGRRVIDMANGQTLRELERLGLRNVHELLEPTMASKFPIFKIDHCYASPRLQVVRHVVHEHDPVSDHRAISTDFSY